MQILQDLQCNDWNALFSTEVQSQSVNTIEQGTILHLPKLAFVLKPQEEQFLSPEMADPKAKNISLNGKTGLLGGVNSPDHYNGLKSMMQRYSHQATQFIQALLAQYANHLEIGRTSFRPAEISRRKTSYRKDDTRLHVDAFPATPNQGRRILRIFTNIHPGEKKRVWRAGESFLNVAEKFLPRVNKFFFGKSVLLKMLKLTKSYRSEYDHIMLQIHDQMKADLDYQATVSQSEIQFYPGSSWIVQTDHVSHAAMSGQHVLEQTFYLPVNAMKNPDFSPLKILEKMTGKVLV